MEHDGRRRVGALSQQWLPIKYRDFYDLPRMIVAEFRGALYLLECPFDEHADEYHDNFVIYRLHGAARQMLDRVSWLGMSGLGVQVGRIAVGMVRLDKTRRRYLDAAVLERLVPRSR
jgi:hypothetical protein